MIKISKLRVKHSRHVGLPVVRPAECGGFETHVHNLQAEIPGWNDECAFRQVLDGRVQARIMSTNGPLGPVFLDDAVP